jgi:hypothetical protein
MTPSSVDAGAVQDNYRLWSVDRGTDNPCPRRASAQWNSDAASADESRLPRSNIAGRVSMKSLTLTDT